MKFNVILLVFLSFAFSVNAQDVSTYTANRADGSNITYYLLHQINNTPSDTLLLILQGSDCNSVLKIKSIFIDYKNVWPEADVLLIEKYGIDKDLSYSQNSERKDCPVQYIQNDSPEQRIADIKTVLNVVRKDNKYINFIVLGGSEGAVIANLLTSSIDYVDATISFNGGGRWFIDDVLYNIASKYGNSEKEKESIEGFKGFSEHVLNSKPFELEVSGHGYHWWNQMLSIDQLDVLQKIDSPLLIVQGVRDLSVSPKKVDEMVSILRGSGKENIEYLTYGKLDHGFNNAEGQSERKRVVTDMNLWLKVKLNNPNKSMQPTANASAD